jgi:hypothetical protein
MRISTWLLVGLVALAACTSASGELRGGAPRYDAAKSLLFDAGLIYCFEDADEVEAGATTWTGIYRDLFGPMTRGGCAGDGACHGTDGQAGSKGSFGFVCADKTGCRQKMIATNLLSGDQDGGVTSAANLIGILRSDRNPAAIMPKRPTCTFSERSIVRIETWVQNGAPDD